MADRAHLSIGEVLSLVQEDFPDVTISKIRFLESQGLLDPERTPSGYRKFYEGDIERLQWILIQQRDHFLPLKVIRERLDEWDATGNRPDSQRQTPDAEDLPGGVGDDATGDAVDDGASTAEPDPRHAATSLAATSAVELLAHPEPDPDGGPEHAAQVAMEAAPRAPEPSVPRSQRSGPDAEDLRVGPSATSLTTEELAARVGVPASVITELESYSLIESKRIGPESYFEPGAVPVVEACRTFLDHGVEVRHLRMYKIAAEREAGMLEQLVMPLLKQRNPDARTRAVDTVRSLSEVGGTLHAALLRAALRETLR
ncbi:MAG: MerR family transcriptional regulator [Acidimicrobiales bacterium]